MVQVRTTHWHGLKLRIEMRSYRLFPLYGAFALISLPAVAQSNSVTPDPVHSSARVPEMKYESAFERYVPYREQPLATWRDVNDEVGRVGGHVGMFGSGGHAGHGGSKPAPAEPPAAAPASASKEAPGQSPARGAPAAPKSQHMGH